MKRFSITSENETSYKATPYLLKPLWFAAGADPVLLKKGTYSDQVKMACLGGTVYATSLLAFFSGSYAIDTVFSEDINSNISFTSWALGAVWALIIFNLDRFIVSSTPPNISDEGNLRKIFSIPFITRIVLGVIIGIVISTPLEIKIFEKDIQKEILAKQPKLIDSLFIERLNENSLYKGLKEDSIKLENNIKKQEELATDNNNKYREETEGKRTGNIGIGTVAKSYKREEEQALSRRKDYEKDLQLLNIQIVELKDNVKLKVEADKDVINSGFNSLVSKASMPHNINPTISLFIVLFLLAIELTPIILKTFMESSPYDYQKNDRDELIKKRSSKEKKNLLELHENEIDQINDFHTKTLDQKQKQFQQRLIKEQNSFDEKIDLMKSKMDDLLKFKMEKEFVEKFNEVYDENGQRLYLKNLKTQKEYIEELDQLEIEDAKRKLEKENRIEDIISQKKISQEARKSKENIELLKIKQNENNSIEKLNKEEQTKPSTRNKQDKNNLGDNSIKLIADDLIEGKSWKKGENYARIKILNKKTILDIIQNEEKSNYWYNSEDNIITTDKKISEYKKNKNIDDAVESYLESTNNEGIKFNLDKARSITDKLKKKIEESKKTQ